MTKRRYTPRFTAQEAVTFEKPSEANASAVELARSLRATNGTHTDCQCKPYEDVFTYDRWQALGFQVQRGETKLVTVATVKTITDKETGKPRQIPWHSALFCRCQVRAKDGEQVTAPPSVPTITAQVVEDVLNQPVSVASGKFAALEI